MQISSRNLAAAIRLVALFSAGTLVAGLPPANAQTFTVIHTFTNGPDGGYPYAGLTIDPQGNLYGTANEGGNLNASCPPVNKGCGTVFKLTPTHSAWEFQTIQAFQGGLTDGQGPYGRVALGPDHNLYGTAIDGGNDACASGCGLVFQLKPGVACGVASCPWRENVLYSFQGNSDGFYPTGDLAFDSSGNIYGTTTQGGVGGPGTIYQLKASNGKWTENILYNFDGQADGANPYSGVILDRSGNIYGTTTAGGINEAGTVVELVRTGDSWRENTLYDFQNGNSGVTPFGGLILGPSGALIGATEAGGANHGGAAFGLIPKNGTWRFTVLNGLIGAGGDSGPWAKLTMDAAGNLYGTSQGNPASGNWGTVFKLTRTASGWKETILYTFTGGTDGGYPLSTLVLDSAGNMYGTTLLGGLDGGTGYGVIFEIKP